MTRTAPHISQGARRYALAILAIVNMFNFIDRQILAILLPSIRDEFGVSDAWLGFLTGTAFAMFYIFLGIPVARYADRHNRRNLIALAVAVWSGMTALSGMAANFLQLALARIGVGIGEAGCSPPAHSMIADLYPPEKRSTAMGVYTIGISAGIMLANLLGGWVVQNIGWREALLIVGLPGLVLAAIVRFSVVEPSRGHSEGREAVAQQPPFLKTLRFLWRRPSFAHMTIAAALSSYVGYSVISFLPSFLVRSYGMPEGQIGLYLGLIIGIVGGAGFFLGGYIADHLGQSGHRRALSFIGITVLLTAIPYAAMFLSASWQAALLLFLVPAATANVYLAPVLSQAQGLVSLRMRAMASALALLIINVIGLALGPLLTGLLSDLLEARFAAESMRYSLLTVTSIGLPWAAYHYVRAGRTIDADLARATKHD
ncbi:MAG: MFS transporter [Gammaproteobacteria bacterium]|nr:MFS transporter [Gammaproteobacteria bacterium]